MEQNSKEQNIRRNTAVIIAAILAFLLLTVGTYAWQSISQHAVNNRNVFIGPVGGRLHDDYEVIGEDHGREEWRRGLTVNKDIYVENYESQAHAGREIFVRIKLYEYMEIGFGAWEEPYESDGTTPNPNYASRSASPLIPGTSRDNTATWSPPRPRCRCRIRSIPGVLELGSRRKENLHANLQ